MKVAIINTGHIVTGDYTDPTVEGRAILMESGRLVAVGSVPAADVQSADVVVDANGGTAIPGLIDFRCTTRSGTTPPGRRPSAFLKAIFTAASTTAISASEVHVPGRPKDPQGVKALALAAALLRTTGQAACACMRGR